MSCIKRVFLNVSMANRIDGLRDIAKKGGVKTSEMQTGDYVFFVNSGRDKIAALVGNGSKENDGGVMAYCKLRREQRLDMAAIRNIPKYFDGRSLNYDKALSESIDSALAKKGNASIEIY